MLCRGQIRKVGLKKAGKIMFVGKSVKLKCKSKIDIGTGVTIQDHVTIDALSRRGVHLGNGSSIGTKSIIRCSGNYHNIGVGFYLGNGSSLADNCFVGATGGVYIGDNVIGGQNIRFHSSNHCYDRMDVNIKEQGIVAQGITIYNNCWIGAGVVFCDGISIGSGCVIGADAVVTKSFPDNCVIAGNPAKIIKYRGVILDES